jgi:hypothetical protein
MSKTRSRAVIFIVLGYGGLIYICITSNPVTYRTWIAFVISAIGIIGVLLLRCDNCNLNVFLKKIGKNRFIFLPWFPITLKSCARCGHIHK